MISKDAIRGTLSSKDDRTGAYIRMRSGVTFMYTSSDIKEAKSKVEKMYQEYLGCKWKKLYWLRHIKRMFFSAKK